MELLVDNIRGRYRAGSLWKSIEVWSLWSSAQSHGGYLLHAFLFGALLPPGSSLFRSWWWLSQGGSCPALPYILFRGPHPTSLRDHFQAQTFAWHLASLSLIGSFSLNLIIPFMSLALAMKGNIPTLPRMKSEESWTGKPGFQIHVTAFSLISVPFTPCY